MPTLISRSEALERIECEGGKPACLMCAVKDREVGPVHAVYEDDEMLVMLPRYVRRWGHIMVMPREHVVSYMDVDPKLWTRASILAHKAARIIEKVQRPIRCYLASTGSSAGEITQSSMHLHIHIIPLYESDDRPSDIFSWQKGIYVGSEREWHELRIQYVEAWNADDATFGRA